MSWLRNLTINYTLLLVLVSVAINTEYASAQNRFEESKIWEDPDKQFRLQYPSNWTEQSRQNSSEEYDVLFIIGGNYNTMTTLGIVVDNLPPFADLKESFKSSVEDTTNNPNNTRKIKLFEGPEFVKYTVDGKPAGSAIWVVNDPENGSKVRAVSELIFSFVGDKFVRLDYTSTPNDFDKYLPEVEKLIQSIYLK